MKLLIILPIFLIIIAIAILTLCFQCKPLPDAVRGFGETQRQIEETFNKAGFGRSPEDTLLLQNIEGLYHEDKELFDDMTTSEYNVLLKNYGIHPDILKKHLDDQREELETHGLAFSKKNANKMGVQYLSHLAERRKSLPVKNDMLPDVLDLDMLQSRHGALIHEMASRHSRDY